MPGWKPHLQRQEPERLVGALRIEDARRCAAAVEHLRGEERRDSRLSDAEGRQRTAERVPLTVADYKDYVLSLEYKWGEKKFAPRLEHRPRRGPALSRASRHVRPIGPPAAESQIQEGDTGDSWAVSSQVSSFVDPKTGRYALPENGGVPVTVGKNGEFERTRHSRVNEYPGWNTLEVIVRGDRATHIVNGVVNMRVSDIKGWDAGTNSWVKVDHGKIALQAESAEIFYRNIKVRPLTPADDMPPEPKAHGGLVPGAAEGDAGRDARCGAVGCHHAVRRQESRRLEERQRWRRRGLEDRQRRDGRRPRAPATSRPRTNSATCSCTWSGAIRSCRPTR